MTAIPTQGAGKAPRVGPGAGSRRSSRYAAGGNRRLRKTQSPLATSNPTMRICAHSDRVGAGAGMNSRPSGAASPPLPAVTKTSMSPARTVGDQQVSRAGRRGAEQNHCGEVKAHNTAPDLILTCGSSLDADCR